MNGVNKTHLIASSRNGRHFDLIYGNFLFFCLEIRFYLLGSCCILTVTGGTINGCSKRSFLAISSLELVGTQTNILNAYLDRSKVLASFFVGPVSRSNSTSGACEVGSIRLGCETALKVRVHEIGDGGSSFGALILMRTCTEVSRIDRRERIFPCSSCTQSPTVDVVSLADDALKMTSMAAVIFVCALAHDGGIVLVSTKHTLEGIEATSHHITNVVLCVSLMKTSFLVKVKNMLSGRKDNIVEASNQFAGKIAGRKGRKVIREYSMPC